MTATANKPTFDTAGAPDRVREFFDKAEIETLQAKLDSKRKFLVSPFKAGLRETLLDELRAALPAIDVSGLAPEELAEYSDTLMRLPAQFPQ